MKKILIALLAVIAILAFLAFSSNNSVNNFFSKDEGVIYKEDRLLWTTKKSDKGLFSSTYITDFSVGKTSFSLSHVSSFNPFGTKVKSTLILPSSFAGNESTKLLSSSSLDDIMPAIKTSLMEYAIVRAKSGVEEFFAPVNGFLYNKGIISWHLDGADVRENGATYKTRFSFIMDKAIDPDEAIIEVFMTHEATFGGENLSLFNIGNLKTTVTIPEKPIIYFPGINVMEGFPNTQFSFDSTITFAGFDSKIVVPEQNISKNYPGQDNFFFNEMIYTFNNDFGKSMFDTGFNIPYVSLSQKSDDDGISKLIFETNGIKMSSQNIFKKDSGLWFTDSMFGIEKVVGYDDETGDQVFILDNLLMKGLVRLGDTNETMAVDSKTSFKKVYVSDDYSDNPTKLEDMNFDITLDRLNAQSIQKMVNAIQHLNPYVEYQLMEFGATFIAEAPRLLEKKPRILINDISANYNDEVHSIKGVVEYVGDGKTMNFFSASWGKQVYAKFDVKIGEKLFTSKLKENTRKKITWSYYNDDLTEAEIEAKTNTEYNDMLEKFKEMNVIPTNGFVAFVAEFKNGEILINGKMPPEDLF